ncbi:chromatin assembly factor 1 subunit p50 [Kluyveromyces marxianus]|uniref:Chromatin assembly factor 1 subunit p50 n=1 Tax=Kluyveromyces marxianus TaxID=4911 RepID=A0ABX6EP51_KLUMA|nr:chromatin assembly factor 1 subunit p50 [Kluyveromyces marxianus]
MGDREMNDLIIEEPPELGSSISEEVQNRYTNWKKNTRLLYDYLNTNTSKWPSLTCQFFPDLAVSNDQQRILLSSFTSQQLPSDESLYISSISTMNHIKWSSINNFDMDEMEFKMDNSVKLKVREKNLQEEVRITYPDGDCNRCRYMPQNPDIIGTVSSNGSVYVFDRTKHGNKISTGRKFEIECRSGNEQGQDESVSLAWNHNLVGILASCQTNGKVNVWDIKKFDKNTRRIENTTRQSITDSNGVNDVSWMVNHTSILASCGESNTISIMDTRKSPNENDVIHRTSHLDGINSIEFNPKNDMLLCTGDSQGQLKLWDIRNFTEPVRSWRHSENQDSISSIQWNPHMPQIVASADQNTGLVKIWNTSESGENMLLFVHGGHMLGVNDISWSLHTKWTICSVSNDNSIHIWKPANNLVESELGSNCNNTIL